MIKAEFVDEKGVRHYRQYYDSLARATAIAKNFARTMGWRCVLVVKDE